MEQTENQTTFTEFVLLGLSDQHDAQLALFVFFLTIYCVTLLGNVVITVLIWVESSLHKPMYFFLGNLSFLDVCYSSSTMPKLLENVLSDKKLISFWGCVVQLFCVSSYLYTVCLLLTAMAYDRYVAICNPLFYPVIMSHRLCIQLAFYSWLTAFVNSTVHANFTFRLSFCSNKINHFLCEIPQLLNLSCRPSLISEVLLFSLAGFISVGSFLLIFLSYTLIISTILKIRSTQSRKKSFSTCSSHITVVTLLYGSAFFVYIKPTADNSLSIDKFSSVFYVAVTPMLNPIIYSLRNVDVNVAVKKLFCKERK